MNTNKEIVEQYMGVNIVTSCGYFYPEINGNIEYKTVRSVKRWIREKWTPLPQEVKVCLRYLRIV